jgi:hypothetical protein
MTGRTGLGGAAYLHRHDRSRGGPVYELKGGKFQLVQVTDLKGRWPDKWQSWLGW